MGYKGDRGLKRGPWATKGTKETAGCKEATGYERDHGLQRGPWITKGTVRYKGAHK